MGEEEKDIVGRLRAHDIPMWREGERYNMCGEAADEIERLRAKLTQNQALLLLIMNSGEPVRLQKPIRHRFDDNQAALGQQRGSGASVEPETWGKIKAHNDIEWE